MRASSLLSSSRSRFSGFYSAGRFADIAFAEANVERDENCAGVIGDSKSLGTIRHRSPGGSVERSRDHGISTAAISQLLLKREELNAGQACSTLGRRATAGTARAVGCRRTDCQRVTRRRRRHRGCPLFPSLCRRTFLLFFRGRSTPRTRRGSPSRSGRGVLHVHRAHGSVFLCGGVRLCMSNHRHHCETSRHSENAELHCPLPQGEPTVIHKSLCKRQAAKDKQNFVPLAENERPPGPGYRPKNIAPKSAPTASSAAPASIAVETLSRNEPGFPGTATPTAPADPGGSSGRELRIFCWT